MVKVGILQTSGVTEDGLGGGEGEEGERKTGLAEVRREC